MSSEKELLAVKINNETAKAHWKELEVFFARGQILLVAKGLDLVGVAVDLSLDNKDSIEALLNSNQLIQPTIDWVKDNCNEETDFWTTVVSPYVLIQPV